MLRVDGMDGAFKAAFSWRWQPTPEDELLTILDKGPREPSVQPASQVAEKIELQPGDWPGFRGEARDGRLFGVSLATDWEQSPPREVWRHRVGPGWSSFAVVGQRIYTQEQRGAEELVVCYDANNGAELWNHSDSTRFTEVVAGPGPRATPTFHEGLIYSLGANGHLDCLDAVTGKVRWTRDIVADSGAKIPQWGFSRSPLVVYGIVSVFAGGPDGKSVLGYQAATGELAWSAGEGSLSYCSTQRVHLDGVDQLLINTDAGLTAFRPETGEVLWMHSWPSDGVARIVQPALVGESDLLIGTGMSHGARRINVSHENNQWPTKELWTSRSIKPYYNDLVVYQDALYGFDGAIFMCVGLDDGRPRWKARGYGNGQVLLLVDQGLLLVLTEQGEVVLVEAKSDKHKEVAKFKAIEGKTWNHPVIAHGKLFVRNAEEAACFELKLAPSAESQAAR
jgi:outer membrane protein assembly factor BamB